MAHKILPPTWLLVSILLMVALRFVFPLAMIIPSFWNLLGLIPLVLGIVLNLQADRLFHQCATTVNPFGQPSVLVTCGVFRFSRNPMYLGFVLILLGTAVLLRSITPFLVIPAFIGLIQSAYIAIEERSLAEEFGPTWEGYCRFTRRWI
jgi:protein-S-isoprenylcysteine O-methyltransferase Ste14